MKKLVSIVIPAFNEAENIIVIIDRLETIFKETAYDAEYIIIDDGSKDKTLTVIKTMASINQRIFYIEFSRNFGQQLALKAGLDKASGDCVISLDADLQHPPELIIQMLKKWEEGYDIVYTHKLENKNLPYGKRKTSILFYKLMSMVSSIELEDGATDFRLLDKKVIEVFRTFEENEPFIRGLVQWMGYKQTAIDFMPSDRLSGSTKYNVRILTRLALQGITSFSIKPLYTAVYLGFTFSLLSVLYVPYVFYSVYMGIEVDGWASTIMTIVFFGGLQLIIMGIIGIYIGKMFMQTKNRPNYIIRSTNLVPAPTSTNTNYDIAQL